MRIEQDFSLLKYNTFGMKTVARRFVEYSSTAELQQFLRSCSTDEQVFQIGGGSNLLFIHPLFEGTILHSAIKGIEVMDEDEESICLKVGAGVVWDEFVAHVVARGWGGAENLSLIPGEVGASAIQNIGAYGVEAKDIISNVYTIDRNNYSVRVFENSDCNYGYRSSIFKNSLKDQYIVTHVSYRLRKHPKLNLSYGNISAAFGEDEEITLQKVRDHIIRIREQKLPDPKVLGNAGSYFMNPVVSTALFESLKRDYHDIPSYPAEDGIKIPAAWLIQQTGWKGKSLGKAAVYEKQPLVLVNTGDAEAIDVIHLADAVIFAVEEKFSIRLKPEVIYV
ncbi:MAG: UDP-N-acetylmuramate dehydrogenase [Bacteroidales bacterium]|nr:UDP-N-acetylmuramate dehydrogenase [Bacteroidales bacterium]